MPFQPGNNANPYGGIGTPARQALNKIRIAMDKAIDGLGNASKDGTTVMGDLICTAYKRDIVGTLKGLSFAMPKDLSIQVTNQVAQMTREQLLDALADCDKVLDDNPSSELH